MTGERISALEGIGEAVREAPGGGAAAQMRGERTPDRGMEPTGGSKDKDRDPPVAERGRGAGVELGL